MLQSKLERKMPKDSEILLTSDPVAFMNVVEEPDPGKRVRRLHTLDDMMVCEALRYGIYNERTALRALMQFYKEVFLQESVDRRHEIYKHVATIVPEIGGSVAGAITPFMLLDIDMGIVSTATIDYTSLGTLLNDDPMTRPKDAIDMITKQIPDNPAAVVGGLLSLGDPRVCDLLTPLRQTLDVDQIVTVTKCFSGVTAKCCVEFYLDWLEETVDRRDYEGVEIFENVAAGLYRLADSRSLPFIIDGLRPFPVPQQADSAWPGVKFIEPDQYAKSISARLFALEQREGVRRVLPHVMRAFGIVPKSKPDEIALMQ
jgi:hypothetical protein